MTSAKESRSEEVSSGRGILVSWRLIALGLLGLAVLVGSYLLWRHMRGTQVERGTRSLVRAFEKRRLIEPRLTGGFKAAIYSDNPEDRAGVEEGFISDARDLLEDASHRGEEGAKAAYTRLLLAQNTKILEAQNHLRAAISENINDPGAHNDLGVCHLLRGHIEEAMVEFRTAVELAPRMSEAQFNLALCYQKLLLRRPAAENFAKFLGVESDTGWIDEGRRRYADLSKAIEAPPGKDQNLADLKLGLSENDEEKIGLVVRRGYEHFVRYGYDLMEGHLKASADNDPDGAESYLRQVERLGEIAQRLKNDSAITSAAQYLRGLPVGKKAAELELLRKFLKAYDRIPQDPREELKLYESIEDDYEERGNHLLLQKTIYGIGLSQIGLRRITDARANFKRSFNIAKEHGWLLDQSRRIMNIGLCDATLGYDSNAIDTFNQCLDLFKRINEHPAKIHQYLGVAYWHLGKTQTSLDHFRKSTAILLAEFGKIEDIAYNYLNIADIYRLAEQHELALLNGEQAVELSRLCKDNNRLAQAISFVAVERARVGALDQAQAEIEEATGLVEQVTGSRQYTEPLVLTRASIVASIRGDMARAISLFEKAMDKAAEGEGNLILSINTLREFADAYIKFGQPERARQMLMKAVAGVEDYRSILTKPNDQIDFLSARQGVFDQLIELNVDEPSRRVEAFGICEQSRARALLDRLNALEGETGDLSEEIKRQDKQTANERLAELQSSMPADTTALLYSVTQGRTSIFAISRTTFEVFTSGEGSAKIEQLVSKFTSDIVDKAPVEGLAETGKALYNLLLHPAESRLRHTRNLCVIPDKALNFLPFRALVDGSGRYLTETHRITIAPSASVWVRCLIRARKMGLDSVESFLGVGNPTLSGEMAETLGELPQAEHEVNRSAESYTNPVILIGPKATETNVRTALKNCTVAHLALHCLVKPESPWLASLALAAKGGDATPDDDGVLTLNEVYSLRLPETRLVILSACQSGLGQYYKGEGIVSLIHPLLCARVSTVVATLWPVESGPTSALMIEFHKMRTEKGMTSGDALREAQLQMLRTEWSHPYYWASFIVVGGNY